MEGFTVRVRAQENALHVQTFGLCINRATYNNVMLAVLLSSEHLSLQDTYFLPVVLYVYVH